MNLDGLATVGTKAETPRVWFSLPQQRYSPGLKLAERGKTEQSIGHSGVSLARKVG